MKQMLSAMTLVACVGGLVLVGGCGGESESSSTPATTEAKAPSVNAMAVKGALVFKKTCASCHGANAKGMPNNGPDLTASQFVKDTSNADLITYVIEGREVPGGVPMPPRGGFTADILPDEDIEKVVAYLKNMPGNRP